LPVFIVFQGKFNVVLLCEYVIGLLHYFSVRSLCLLVIDLYQDCDRRGGVVWDAKLNWREKVMLQEGDKSILVNIAKVIAVLVVVTIALIFIAGSIGSGL
jgi:hypothetical protein